MEVGGGLTSWEHDWGMVLKMECLELWRGLQTGQAACNVGSVITMACKVVSRSKSVGAISVFDNAHDNNNTISMTYLDNDERQSDHHDLS